MTEQETIAFLRCCADIQPTINSCNNCPLGIITREDDESVCACAEVESFARSIYDLIEAQGKRIAELKAQIPKHGHWLFTDDFFSPPKCSNCGKKPRTPGYMGDGEFYKSYFPRCPACGDIMDGEVEVIDK